jgi:hypothetical protein
VDLPLVSLMKPSKTLPTAAPYNSECSMGIKFIAMCVQPGVYTRFNALVRQTIVLIQLNAADLK